MTNGEGSAEDRCRAIAPDFTIEDQAFDGRACLVARATVRGHLVSTIVEVSADSGAESAREQLALGMERKLARIDAMREVERR